MLQNRRESTGIVLLVNEVLINDSKTRPGLTLTIETLKPSEITQNYLFKVNLLTLLNLVRDNNINSEEKTSSLNQMVNNNIQEALFTHVIYHRKIKRVAQSLIIENNKLITKNIGAVQMPIVYILYCLGKSELGDFNQLSLTETKNKCCGELFKHNSTNSSNSFDEFISEMLNDTDYVAHIEKGIGIFNRYTQDLK